MDHQQFRGKRVTVIGLGVEGVDLVRYLAAEGASVTVSDARRPEDLRNRLDAIEDLPVTLSLGANRPEAVADAEFVFASQGVPRDLPLLRECAARGVPVSSMTQLFFERCPAPIAGITGSSGKTTTTALVGAMLAESGQEHAIGGNIGVGLLGLLERIGPATRVVVELSHTQLEGLDTSPHIACVTNVTPNHLDRYSWDDYVALKRRIFEFQGPDDVAVFGIDNPVAASFAEEARAQVRYTSAAGVLPGDGVMLAGDAVVRVQDGARHHVIARDEIPLRGAHNLQNVLAAIAVACELRVSDEHAARAIRAFKGVPHRLEPVATVGGVRYINDSIATTPERALAGIRAFGEPLVLLLGGREKHLPLEELASAAVRHCRAVVTFGEAGPLFAEAIETARQGAQPALEQAPDVPAAVEAARRLAQPGDVVLFSPAATSFDAFRTFEERGAAFREAVRALPGARDDVS